MNTTVYPSLQMFERKCGIGDLFAEGHFNDTEEGLTKPQALARVAMWSAVKDYFKIAECLTPGQAATIVDAAPMIIGKDVEKLNKVKTLFDLHGFVFENAKKWDKGIVVCSQLWSLHHLANGKIPKETFYNSKISDKDYLQSALVAHFLERGDLEKSDPKTAYAIMFDADGFI